MKSHVSVSSSALRNQVQSDTCVIWGCGASINDITPEQMNVLCSYDSIGFNWFCFSKIPTRFYLIREQAVGGQLGRETREVLTKTLEQDYGESIVVISNLRTSTRNWASGYDWARNRSMIKNRSIVVNEAPGKRLWADSSDRQTSFFEYVPRYDPFVDGLLYDFCTMTSILHLVHTLRYRRIIFAGVDLYDHRYFWLRPDELRETTRSKGRALEARHYVGNYTVKLVEAFTSAFPLVSMSVLNPRSLLAEVIPVWTT